MPRTKEEYLDLAQEVKQLVMNGQLKPSIVIISKHYDIPRTTLEGAWAKIGINTDVIRAWARGEEGINLEAEKKVEEAFYYRPDGDVSFNRLISMSEKDASNPEKVLKLCGLDPEKWKVKSYSYRRWTMPRAEDQGQMLNYYIRLDASPKEIDDLTLDDIKRFFEEYPPPRRSSHG